MFSTLKPIDIVIPTRESAQTVTQDDSQAPSEDARVRSSHGKTDMRGNPDMFMASVDFLLHGTYSVFHQISKMLYIHSQTS